MKRPVFSGGGTVRPLSRKEWWPTCDSGIRFREKAASFRTFAEVCIKNRLISVIKAAARDKHIPLNNYVSFETPLFSGNGDHYAYGAADQLQEDPEAILLGREAFQERMRALEGQLSGFEASILRLYLKRSVLFRNCSRGKQVPEIGGQRCPAHPAQIGTAPFFWRFQRELNAILHCPSIIGYSGPWATKQREGKIMYEDKTLVCENVGQEFVFTAGEQEFYAERGFRTSPSAARRAVTPARPLPAVLASTSPRPALPGGGG